MNKDALSKLKLKNTIVTSEQITSKIIRHIKSTETNQNEHVGKP